MRPLSKKGEKHISKSYNEKLNVKKKRKMNRTDHCKIWGKLETAENTTKNVSLPFFKLS